MNKYEEIMRRLVELESKDFETDFKKFQVEEDINSLETLNGLIGLDNIKKEINKLVSYLEFINKVKDKTNIDSLNLHMIFSGNPGSGKTTVARLLAGILYKMGYLQHNKFAEITPRACIAGHVGQTALKTKELIDKYRGGLIFIDEAYIFNDSNDTTFTKEAIVEIIKAMEKKDTVFVFAGYKKQMKEFIDINPGLRSRIGYEIEFEDYSQDELLQIFIKKVSDSNLKIDDLAIDKFKNLLGRYKENSGNGRLIDNLYNKILLEHAIRTENIIDDEILLTINKEDINIEDLMLKEEGVFFA